MKYVAVESYSNPAHNIILCEGTLLECRAHTEKYIAEGYAEDADAWEYDEKDQIYWYEDGGYDPACINLMPVD